MEIEPCNVALQRDSLRFLLVLVLESWSRRDLGMSEYRNNLTNGPVVAARHEAPKTSGMSGWDRCVFFSVFNNLTCFRFPDSSSDLQFSIILGSWCFFFFTGDFMDFHSWISSNSSISRRAPVGQGLWVSRPLSVQIRAEKVWSSLVPRGWQAPLTCWENAGKTGDSAGSN